jgi:hypothetical protein
VTLLGGLEPVDLDTLNGAAALLRRFDAKYVVPVSLLPRLVNGLGAGVRVLEMAGLRSFAYDTTYLDTVDLRTFRDHRMGRRRRFKVRERVYSGSPDPASFIEVKLRGLRDMTAKERWESRLVDGRLRAEDAARVAAVIERHYGERFSEPLEASLVTSFARSTLFDPASRERITLDTDVSVRRPGGPPVRLGARHALVEVKSGDPRSRGHTALASLGVHRTAMSKYCIGIALTRDVSANAWRPVIRMLAPASTAPH